MHTSCTNGRRHSSYYQRFCQIHTLFRTDDQSEENRGDLSAKPRSRLHSSNHHHRQHFYNPLKVTDKFTYLGSTISQNALIDDEISARIDKASGSFGKLTKRLWSERGVRLATKIKWPDMIPNTEVLQRCAQNGIEHHIKRAQLRWSGHFVRMDDDRIPKAMFYGELDAGHRTWGGQRKRYKDVLKGNVEVMRHSPQHLGSHCDRPCPLAVCHSGLRDYKEKRCDALRDQIMRRKAIQPSSNIDTSVCHVCGRLCRSRIGMHSHSRTHANTNTD